MSAAVWRRRGEEAETDDFRAGNPVCVDEAEVYSALAASLDGDLPQDDPERTEALESAVEGYLAEAAERVRCFRGGVVSVGSTGEARAIARGDLAPTVRS